MAIKDQIPPPNPHYQPPRGLVLERFSLDEGHCMLEWPALLSPEDAEDVIQWLELMIRKARRRIAGFEVQPACEDPGCLEESEGPNAAAH